MYSFEMNNSVITFISAPPPFHHRPFFAENLSLPLNPGKNFNFKCEANVMLLSGNITFRALALGSSHVKIRRLNQALL